MERNIEYKAVYIHEAVEKEYPEVDEYMDYDDGYGIGIWKFVDGVAVELLSTDGGEPEDNNFARNGGWIAPALNDAYKLGLEHSKPKVCKICDNRGYVVFPVTHPSNPNLDHWGRTNCDCQYG